MNSKLIGGSLLVIGTAIGAGILALPLATAELGFFGSVILLFSVWLIMTASAFIFLEVNLRLPPNSNLISMAGATLGKSGQAVVWVVYSILLYSIISAYIAGGGDLFHYLLINWGINISLASSSVLFTFLFGSIVYFGIRSVDYVNRSLMFGKMGAYLLLVVLMVPFISAPNLSSGEFKYMFSPSSITVTAAAFTSAMIIPSLRTYFGDHDIKTLRKVIFIGMTIPLLCYIAWDAAIMGVIPLNGSPGLKEILHSQNSTSDIVAALTTLLRKDTVTMFAKFFTSICMVTSFLSISLCLSDFLSDGLRVAKKGMGNLVVFGATFVPPMLVVLFYPDIFIRGLHYAGVCCVILMIFLPPLMAWRGRYHLGSASLAAIDYRVRGGKFLLALLVIFATLMIGFGIEGAI